MKDFKVFTEHAELVAEWSKALQEMQEKAGKKKDGREKPKKKPEDMKITPRVLDGLVAGLRIKVKGGENEGEEFTIVKVGDSVVHIQDPLGNIEEVTPASLMSRFYVD